MIIIEVDCSTSPPAVTRLTVYRGPYIPAVSGQIDFNQDIRRRSSNLSVHVRRNIMRRISQNRTVSEKKNSKKEVIFSDFLKKFLRYFEDS